jgi:transposase InsO family protein
MMVRLHKKARTTPQIRREIQASDLPTSVLARQYGVCRHTIRKWRNRDSVQDASHRPHRIHATLTEAQEAIVLALRETLLLPLDDLLAVVRQFICPELSRSALDRCLRRHGLSRLDELIAAREGHPADAKPKPKSFKDYAPGFVHVDIKHLPKMPGDARGRYLFAAIDRATRWVYLEVHASKQAKVAAGFLKRLIAKAPFQITKVLTDNGKEFTDRFCATGQRQPTGQHPFDRICAKHAIEHRLTQPYTPKTNGMIERFNGRIAEILKSTHFRSAHELEQTLLRYARVYNHQIPQKALGHISPVQALKDWQTKRPELFKKHVYNLAGLDM